MLNKKWEAVQYVEKETVDFNNEVQIVPDRFIWVCSVCGKISKSRYGWDKKGKLVADINWGTNCVSNAVLCWND